MSAVADSRLRRSGLPPPGFCETADYDVLYRARDIRDAIYVVCPLNEDAESYLGWYRVGEGTAPFASDDRDLLAYGLRALKWLQRRVMLHHGLLIAKTPLTAMQRRLVSLLLTEPRREGDRARARAHARDEHVHHRPVPQVRCQRPLRADGPLAREGADVTTEPRAAPSPRASAMVGRLVPSCAREATSLRRAFSRVT
jgi:hypothetical protein